MENYKLPIEQKENWCKALRSGEYEQGTGMLKTDDGKYCCLGVWAVVNNIGITENGRGMVIDGGEMGGYKPIEDLIGDKIEKLYHMNDGTSGEIKHTFPEIADWIEKNL